MGYSSFYINGKELKDLSINGRKIWEKEDPVPPQPVLDNFWVRSRANNNTVTLNSDTTKGEVIVDLDVSTDGVNWSTFTGSVVLQKNQYAYFRTQTGNVRMSCQYSSTLYNRGRWFDATQEFDVGGNVKSLLLVDMSQEITSTNNGAYAFLFRETTKLINANELYLGTSLLASRACYLMFADCQSIRTPPKVSQVTGNVSGYAMYKMFYNCSSLQYAEEIRASQFTNTYTCSYMYQNCTSLTHAASIYTTFAAGSKTQQFVMMYANCTNITGSVTVDTGSSGMSNSCFSRMFDGTGLQSATLRIGTIAGTAPLKLMFNGCSNLNEIHVDFSAWGDTTGSRTTYWVKDVSASGDFYCPSALPQEFGDNRIPSGWTVHTS